ncbi:type II toxin-antitoxin system Phd/YefM family antitoxin [Burkholderia sp. Bp8963]|uniref:type II toxin-antitoxin system Phd/YefM family antitoxin n=1 Tax=Burkholderia sp. Bp8963 TaxID=2184547 RepID=UPI00163A74A4|nr:type II toxin-antitoxin system Phd/YefM family antitoxin [Burkholderia sp. Bp8963]
MLERFVEHSPMAIMTRLVMQGAIYDEWLDAAAELDDEPDGEQIREALLARVVDALVALAAGTRPAGGGLATAVAISPEFAPAVTALHDQMSRLRAGWGRLLVKDSIDLLLPLTAPLGTEGPAAGWRLRVLDGGVLPAGLACAPGPAGCTHGSGGSGSAGGGALPVYDPDLGMIVDLVPYERSRAHERAFVCALLEAVQPGELWIIDGRFNTAAILSGWPRRGGAFIVREHGCAPAWQPLDAPRECGALDGGRVYEQAVAMADDGDGGAASTFRRIEWRPDESAAAGAAGVAADSAADAALAASVLTNAPAAQFDALQVMRLARRRWRDALPLPVDAALGGGLLVNMPPRAALLARGIAAIAYNVCGVMANAVRAALDLDAREVERLPSHIAAGVRAAYAGMMIALPPSWWRRYDQLPATALGEAVRLLAGHVDPRSERRKRRENRLTVKSQAQLRAATVDGLLQDEGDDAASNVFCLRTIAMATRDFSSNPSKALRHASEALVMVTKYNRPIALLVSIEDWNRLVGEVRETSVRRLSLDYAGTVDTGVAHTGVVHTGAAHAGAVHAKAAQGAAQRAHTAVLGEIPLNERRFA